MTRFLIRRVLWAMWLFVVATLVTYLLFYVISPNPFLRGGDAFSDHIRSELHLDVSVYQQYWIFLWNIVRYQSLGYSFQDGAPVRSILVQDAGVTGSLVFGGLVFWILISFPIGIVSALRPGIARDDIPLVAGVIIFITLAVIVMNFIVDVAYVWLDPRIRLMG